MAEAMATARQGYGEYLTGLKGGNGARTDLNRRAGYTLGRQPSSHSIPDSESDDDLLPSDGRGNNSPPHVSRKASVAASTASSHRGGIGSAMSFASDTSSFYDPPANEKWHCQLCTYENADRKNAKCALCGQKREDGWTGIPLAPPPFGGTASPPPVPPTSSSSPTGPHHENVSGTQRSPAHQTSGPKNWETSGKGSLNRFLQHKSRNRSGRSGRGSKSSASSVVSEGSTSTVRVSNIHHVRPMPDGGSTAGPSKPGVSEAIVEEEDSEEEYSDDVEEVVQRPPSPAPAASPAASAQLAAPTRQTSQSSQRSSPVEQRNKVTTSRLRFSDAATDDANSLLSGSSQGRSCVSTPSPRVGSRKKFGEPGASMASPRSMGLGTLVQSKTNLQRASSGTSSSSRSVPLDSSVHSQNSRKVPVPHESSDDGLQNHRMSTRKKLNDRVPPRSSSSGGILGIHLATSFRGGQVTGGSTNSARRDNSSVDTQRTSRSMPVISSSSRSMPPGPPAASPGMARRPSNHSLSSDASHSIDPSVISGQSGRTSATGRVPAPDPMLDHAQPRRMSNQSSRSNYSNQGTRQRTPPKYSATPSSRVVPIIHPNNDKNAAAATEQSIEVSEKMLKTPPEAKAEFDDEVGSLPMIYGAPSVTGDFDTSSRGPASTAAVYDCETSVANRGTTSSTVAATYDDSVHKKSGLPNGNDDWENPAASHHISVVSGLTTTEGRPKRMDGNRWLRYAIVFAVIVILAIIIIASIVLRNSGGGGADGSAKDESVAPALQAPTMAPLPPFESKPSPVSINSPAPAPSVLEGFPQDRWESVWSFPGDSRPADEFGSSVSFSHDGRFVAMGSTRQVVFSRYEDGGWGSPISRFSGPPFVGSVPKIVSCSNEAIAVSIPSRGAVLVTRYDREDLLWESAIRAQNVVALSLREDGAMLAVGVASNEQGDGGFVRVYKSSSAPDGEPLWKPVGGAVGSNGGYVPFEKMDLVLIGEELAVAGSTRGNSMNQVWVYYLEGDEWKQKGEIVAYDSSEAPSVGLSGSFLAVGSDRLYAYNGTDWDPQKVEIPYPLVSLSRGRLVTAKKRSVRVTDLKGASAVQISTFDVNEIIVSLDHVGDNFVVGDATRGSVAVYKRTEAATEERSVGGFESSP